MYAKISKWVMWLLMAISVIIVIWGSMTGFESNGGTAVDVLFRWTYVLAAIAIGLIVILGIVLGAMNDPKSLVKLAAVLVLVVVVVGIVYATASGTVPQGWAKDAPSDGVLKLTDTVLNLTYLFAGAAILSIVVGEIVSATRK